MTDSKQVNKQVKLEVDAWQILMKVKQQLTELYDETATHSDAIRHLELRSKVYSRLALSEALQVADIDTIIYEFTEDRGGDGLPYCENCHADGPFTLASNTDNGWLFFCHEECQQAFVSKQEATQE